MRADSGAAFHVTDRELDRLDSWIAAPGVCPRPVDIGPDWPFNIIYSSGTTGTPKGIVQPHSMRWGQVRRAEACGYGADAVTLIATPLYSNTTLVMLSPTLARGGTVVADAEVRRARLPRARRSSTAPRTRCWCRCSTSA